MDKYRHLRPNMKRNVTWSGEQWKGHQRDILPNFMSDKSKQYKNGLEELGCADPKMYYLSTGAPGEEELTMCANIIEQATLHRLQREKRNGNLYQYGPIQGDWEFRNNLAEFLSSEYEEKVKRENVFATCGATHGLLLICSLVLPRNCVVFVEEPTYFMAISMLRDDLGFHVVPVPSDDEGIDIDVFSDLLQEYHEECDHETTERYPFWSMLFTVPTYNNPTGRCLDEERMRSLVRLSREYDMLIVADDVYNLLHYDPSSALPKRLLAYDCPTDPDYKGNVISNGSFSKILSPGLRLGWLEAPDRVVDVLLQTYVLKSGGGSNHYVSGIVASVLALNLQTKHLNHLRCVYKKHIDTVLNVLENELPSTVQFTKPKGGYFIWITLPEGSDAEVVRLLAEKKYGVTFKTGVEFTSEGVLYRECIRMGVTYYNTLGLTKATRLMCKAIKEYLTTTT